MNKTFALNFLGFIDCGKILFYREKITLLNFKHCKAAKYRIKKLNVYYHNKINLSIFNGIEFFSIKHIPAPKYQKKKSIERKLNFTFGEGNRNLIQHNSTILHGGWIHFTNCCYLHVH